MYTVDSSVISKYTVPLFRASLALRRLSALHITMCWLPALNVALVWLPTTRFFISRAPNMITTSEVELQPLNWLPALAPSPTYSPVLAPYSGSHNPVLHLQIESRIIVM